MVCGAKSLAIGFSSGLLALLLSAATAKAGWELTFSDEFEGESLDLGKWKLSDLWNNGTLSGNGEQQCYVPGGAAQSNGLLALTARQSFTSASSCKGASSDLRYTSGIVTTAGCNRYETSDYCKRLKPFAQAYGYFEIRAKLPKGRGFWPAFWLIPIDPVWPPEIDVMEALGHQPSTIYHTYHYNSPTGVHEKAGNVHNGHDFTSTFSTFGVDWQPGLLVWYVDGRETGRFASPHVASQSMYLLLNLAVGGHWPGNPDQATTFPSSMLIDYVRVYRRVPNGQPDDLPPTHPLGVPK
jgi:beta-glucanase (GH16 family)